MALSSSKNARWFDKSAHMSDFTSHTSTTPSREHIDKHAARRAARDYGLRASQRNRSSKMHRAATNSGSQIRISGSPSRTIKDETCSQKNKTPGETQRQNSSPGQKQENSTHREITERKEKHMRQVTMSRVLNWVQESSKRSIADGTLHGQPTDSSVGENSSVKELEREQTTQLNSPGNVRHRRPSVNAGIQAASPDKQNSVKSARKHLQSKKKSATSPVAKETSDQRNKNRSRDSREDEDAEEGESIEDNAEATIVRLRLQELIEARNSLLAERRVIRLRIEEVQLRREVRQLAREVAKARSELAYLALKEHREIQDDADAEASTNTIEQKEHAQQQEVDTLNLRENSDLKIAAESTLKNVHISKDETPSIQHSDQQLMESPRLFEDSDAVKGAIMNCRDEIYKDQGECSVYLEGDISSKVDSPVLHKSPEMKDNCMTEIHQEDKKFDLGTDADTDSARCQSIENIHHIENTTPVLSKTNPAFQEPGSSDNSSQCAAPVLVLTGAKEGVSDAEFGPSTHRTLEHVNERVDDCKESALISTEVVERIIVQGKTEEVGTCTFGELQAYVLQSKDLKSAPVGLMDFIREKDYDSFAKASSYDGVEMLSAGDEQGDSELKETFSEVVKRLAGGRLDLHNADSYREENEDKLVSKSSGTLSVGSEYETNIDMLPSDSPDNPATTETTASNDEEEDLINIENEPLVECNAPEASESEGLTGANREQRPDMYLPLEPLLSNAILEDAQMKSSEANIQTEQPQGVFFVSPRNIRNSPRSPRHPSPTDLDKTRSQDLSDASKSGVSESTGSREALSVHEALITASTSSSCWVQFSQTDASYIECLVAQFIRAFADPVLPEHLHEDELPLPLPVFFRIEKELGNSYVQEAFDRAVFDSVNRRLKDIYRCCGRLKVKHLK
eukprot:g4062.t2